MNFEDEPYVRLYIRDTASWLLMTWQAQTVLLHMLRGKFDRAGVFDCDGHEMSRAVTAVTRLPAELVEPGLAELLETGTWVARNGQLVWPRYLEGQTAAQSDKARQRKSRENRRAVALSQNVTGCDTAGQDVTDCHEPSHDVTLAQLSLDQPSLEPPVVPQPGDEPEQEATETEPRKPNGKSDNAEAIAKVFAFWQTEHGHQRAKLDRKRKGRINARLREGFTVRDLCMAIRNAKFDQHLMGGNADGKVYDGIQTLLRDCEQVERLRDMKKKSDTARAEAERNARRISEEAEQAERRRAELRAVAAGIGGDG